MPPHSQVEYGTQVNVDYKEKKPAHILKKVGSQSSRKGLSVSFSHKKHIKKIPHLNNLSDEIIEDCWYAPEDYEDIKASFQYLVFMMDSGEDKIDNAQETSRGLEFRTQEGAWERFEHKRDAYNAVLDEQDRQWNKNFDDPERIAQLYQAVCTECQGVATARGKQDEEEIQSYLRDARDEWKRLLRGARRNNKAGRS